MAASRPSCRKPDAITEKINLVWGRSRHQLNTISMAAALNLFLNRACFLSQRNLCRAQRVCGKEQDFVSRARRTDG
jgi:hypothetical protein